MPNLFLPTTKTEKLMFRSAASKALVPLSLSLLLVWMAVEIPTGYGLTLRRPSLIDPLVWAGCGLAQWLIMGAFVFLSSQGLHPFPLSRSWRLRGAFLLGALITVGIGGLLWRSFTNGTLLWLLIGWLGSYSGALAATATETPLSEENFPPTLEIQNEVLERHRERMAGLAPLPGWKRVIDLSILVLTLPLTLPLGILLSFLIWFEDPGPILFVKNSVGRGGRNFRQLKFRTMQPGAENESGPVLAQTDDPRILWVGKLYRKTALDELPQLLNILLGEMSFVGPRPQRTVLVRKYLEELPQYVDRHSFPPGLAGLAQVAGDYYLTPLQKLRFDRLYIQHASLGFDLRLLLAACLVTFVYRWKKEWNGRLPRWALHSSRIVASRARRSTGSR
ncbi:MAG: sugar transferase [Chloroflexota bacterium]